MVIPSMKSRQKLLAAGAFLSAAIVALAIPDNFGFIGVNMGQEIEKVVQQPSAWEGNGLPGEWKGVEIDGRQIDTLQDAAMIFGVLASKVTAERDTPNGGITAFQISYDRNSANQIRGSKPLFDVLLFSIQAYSGAQPQRSGQEAVFRNDQLVISAVSSSKNEALVRLTRP